MWVSCWKSYWLFSPSALRSLRFVNCFLLATPESTQKAALRLIHCAKKCTLFSNVGAAFNNASPQSACMKTEEKLIRPKPAGITLKRILVAIDFSPLSKKALHYALRFAAEFGAGVMLLHVIDTGYCEWKSYQVCKSAQGVRPFTRRARHRAYPSDCPDRVGRLRDRGSRQRI